MTKVSIVVLFLMINLFSINLNAQSEISKPSIAILELDADGMNQDAMLLTDLCRSNLYQIGQFTVMDKYDIDYLLKDKDVDLENCYGSICLSNVGKVLNVDKMLSGNIQRFPKKFTIRLRLIDVNNQIVEKDQVIDFLKIENNLSEMFEVSLKKMFNIPVDQVQFDYLTKETNYEITDDVPEIQSLSLAGPRAGIVVVTGGDADIMAARTDKGGFDSRPVMFQFGYQFEKTYLNSGNIQALFEVIPMISGVAQGRFIPSITFLNGIRNNRNGFEFAFGPVVFATQKAKGFYQGGEWYLKDDRALFPKEEIVLESRFDSRGDAVIDTGLVFAVGKTFKSGKINFPVNIFTTIKKKDIRFGASVGFNAVK